MGFAFTTGPDTRRKPGQQATAGTKGRTATWARHIPSLRSLSFFSPSVHAIAAMAAVTLLTACGAGNGRFRIEGRFRNLNRGEFYVYSPDGGTQGRDTIQVADGRFSYNVPLSDKATFILIFPNFSELVVFGDNGKLAKLSGDVSHMKEIEVSGSDDNELMTKFRMSANRMAPPEVKKAVADFVGEHPASPVSMYLVDRYYIRADEPDYAAAAKLLKTMLKADPTNGRTALLLKQTEMLKPSAIGAKLPQFAATDTDGKAISLKNLNGKVNVVSAWASWSYDSQNIQRWLRRYKTAKGNDLAVVSLCLDGDKATCLRELKADSINWPTVCDGLMWDTPLMARFGLATVPGNIVADADGRIVARNLSTREMREQLEKMLGKLDFGSSRER